jgi:hypothetical protein
LIPDIFPKVFWAARYSLPIFQRTL